MDKLIRERAYYKWINNQNSSDVCNWLEAEIEIKGNVLNIDFLKSGQQFSESTKEDILEEAKYINRNIKLDEFYNKTLEPYCKENENKQ